MTQKEMRDVARNLGQYRLRSLYLLLRKYGVTIQRKYLERLDRKAGTFQSDWSLASRYLQMLANEIWDKEDPKQWARKEADE